MENYINNIVEDMKKYMDYNPKATPEEARKHVAAEAESALVVVPRKEWHIARHFVLEALKDGVLREGASNYIENCVYKYVVLYDDWCGLDAELYSMVCWSKKDEIIARMKESSTTCRQLS